MTGLDTLFQHIAAEEDALRAGASYKARVRERLALLDAPVPAGNHRPRWFAVAALVSAAAALALFAWRSLQPPALTVAINGAAATTGAWISAAPNEVVPLRFSDGTQIDIDPGSRGRIVELAPLGAQLLLESGRARVHVKSRPHANWQLSMGPFAVHVTGTQFEVAWHPEQDTFELDLHEGSVELTGCVFGQGQRVTAGQSVRASCKRGQVSVAERAPTAALGSAASAPDLAVVAPAEAAAVAPGLASADASAARREGHLASRALVGMPNEATGYAPLARAGKYKEAFAVADAGGFENECARASANDLLLLGDAARYAHQPRKSEYALRTLRRRFSHTNDSALAAFALGRLSFDALSAYSEAATWFQTYLKEQPGGSLTREARGRLVEALGRAGNPTAARDAALRYLKDYPTGPHAELARRLAQQ